MFTRLCDIYLGLSEILIRFMIAFYQSIQNKIRAQFIPISSESILIVRITPKSKIAILNPDKMPANSARKLLENIMPANDNISRNSYDFLPYFTGTLPFLSMSDDEALPIRKKRIVPYLHSMFKNMDYKQETQTLINKLRENKNLKSNEDIVRDQLLSLFSRYLLGVEFPDELKKLLLDIESRHVYGIFPAILRNMLAMTPSMYQLRKKYDVAIRDFLVDAIKKINSNNTTYHEKNKNFLFDMMLEKVGDVKNIPEEKIISLANDPEIRMCTAIALGTLNLMKILKPLMFNLKFLTIESLLIEILSQARDVYEISPKNLLDKEKMPLLHATYLEALRYGLKNNLGITRYIESEIRIDDIYIPSHSLVLFPLDSSSSMGTSVYQANEFCPERFINNEGGLRDDIKLHEGLFTPFGVGVRMCPGQYIAELTVKMYLIAMLNEIRMLNEKTILFYGEIKGDTARNRVFPLFKNYIEFSLFNRQSNSSVDSKITEDIAEKVGSYCL